MNAAESFRAAMAAAGLQFSGPIVGDGALHRIKAGEDKEANSWYVFHEDEHPAGAFGCWKQSFSQNWFESNGNNGRPDASVRKRWSDAKASGQAEEVERQKTAATKAALEFAESTNCKNHDYLARKQVQSYGLKIATDGPFCGWIVLPLSDGAGKIWNLQFVAADGTKRFHYGGRVKGCSFTIGEKRDGPIVVCEGYATGASIHQATLFQTVCAMNCGNLVPVASDLRKRFPNRLIVIAADDDSKTEGNPGLTKAKEAAKAAHAFVAHPIFSDESPGTDFNDLHIASGLDVVRCQIESAFPVRAKPIGELSTFSDGDPDELLGRRYLCRGGGLLLIGPTGMGKSSLMLQCLACWANGIEAFGIKPKRALTAVVIQAENDEGDMAEIRDGIAKGLDFSAHQRRNFYFRVLVYNEATSTAKRFCAEVVSPLLTLHNPDILAIDPALSYLGGDSKEQKAVGDFLRNQLNPLVQAHRCGLLLVHHSNKPASGNNQKPEWTTSELAYLGSGSAEWANWARAVLAVQSTSDPGIFRLHAGKRGGRLGWKDSDGNRVYEKAIKHSTEEGTICWIPATAEEVPKIGRPAVYSTNDLTSCLPDGGLTTNDWFAEVSENCGMSKRKFFDKLSELKDSGKVLRSKINQKWQPITSK